MSRIYKVKKGDTLQLIAEKLQISVNDLRHYHNMRCELWELLEQKLTSKTERIIVPSEEELAILQGHQKAVQKELERPSRYIKTMKSGKRSFALCKAVLLFLMS